MVATTILSYFFNTSVLIAIVTVFLIYKYLTRNYDYWKKKGIPYVRPYFLIGTLWDNQKMPLSELEKERYRKCGPVYGYFESDRPTLSVGDPAMVRDILSKEFQTFPYRRVYNKVDEVFNASLAHLRGDDWKRVRAVVSPVFTTGKLKRMMGIIEDCSRTLEQNFRKAAASEEPVDVKKYFSAFTMDTIASAAFSTKVDSHSTPENRFVVMAHQFFTKEVRWRYYLCLLLPRLTNLFNMAAMQPKSVEFFANVTHQLIEERRKNKTTSNDFLQLLMDSAQEIEEAEMNEKKNENKENGNETKKSSYSSYSKVISLNEIIAQCVIFFLAGYETTASTLSFIAYELALNPEVQEQLYEEVKRVLEENKGEITYEAIQNMPYMDKVVSETLRLHSPVIRLERVSAKDFTFEKPKLFIPKGTVITIPTVTIHRNPEYYPDPEKFDPERFTPEEIAKRNQYTYMPFGLGPRNCIAMRFALVEIKICLSQILPKFKFVRSPQTKVPAQFSIGHRHLVPNDTTLIVEERKN